MSLDKVASIESVRPHAAQLRR
jgi:hypothetical protein